MNEAAKLKTAALCWLRFVKQMPYVATEVGSYSADVAGADLRTLIEIEVKTNEADVRRDFQNKKRKHSDYRGDPRDHMTTSVWIPNRFFYLVPARLEEYALKYLQEKSDKYGVMVYEESGTQFKLGNSIRIARKSGYLHKNLTAASVCSTFLKRMGSDLCHLHLTRSQFEDAFDRMKALSKECVELRESVDDPL